MKDQINKLGSMLGMAGLDGTVSIAALAGLFKLENSLMIAILFMAGPGAIVMSLLSDGTMKERILTALFAGMIATVIVIFAAGIGPKVLVFLDLTLLRVFGGLAVVSIGLIIIGLKIPEKTPLMIMGFALVVSFLGGLK